MDPAQFLQGETVKISNATYAVCRTTQEHPTAFATIRDGTETTVVVDEDSIDTADADTIESGWKRLTFDVELPFELVGFLAAVTTALAEANVAVFAFSSYSTDHVLVKETDLDDAVSQLETLGCTVVEGPIRD